MSANTHPMTIQEHSIGLSFYFEIGAHANPQAVEKLVADSVPTIRRYLDDPINATSIGQKAEPSRNAFLALLLAVDRAGMETGTLSVLPAEPSCDLPAHAAHQPARCGLCRAMHVLAAAQKEKLIHVRRVAGEKAEGRYVRVTDVAIEPGEAVAGYRERIKRLSLPLLMTAAPASAKSEPEPVPGEAKRLLPGLRIGAWSELSFDVHATTFTVSGVTGNRADLGLTRELWALFGDFAKAGGQLRPKLLGGSDPRLGAMVELLRTALKKTFPHTPGNPIESQAGGAYKTAFAISSGDLPEGGLRWGSG